MRGTQRVTEMGRRKGPEGGQDGVRGKFDELDVSGVVVGVDVDRHVKQRRAAVQQEL